MVARLRDLAYESGSPLLKVTLAGDHGEAEQRLRDRAAAALVIIPADFSAQLAAFRSGDTSASADLTFVGDLTNPTYTVAAVMAMTAANPPRPVELVEIPLGASAVRTEFENYVPGLFVLAVVLMVFQAAMTPARDIESGALRRLHLTPLTAFDYLGGTSLWLGLVSIAAVGLTFATAALPAPHPAYPFTTWLTSLSLGLSRLPPLGLTFATAAGFGFVDGAFDHPLALEEHATFPLAGGVEQMGFQCGQVWGAALAAGARAYQLFGSGPEAEAAAVIAAQRLAESFRASYKSINCFEVIDLDWKNAQAKQVLKFLLKGGPIRCFSSTAGYARAAFSEINATFAGQSLETPAPPVSCAALLARKMGASDLHTVMAAGLAGGIGLSGGACGALGAAIWLIEMNRVQSEEPGKSSSTAPKPPRRSIGSCRAATVNSSAPKSSGGSSRTSPTMPPICTLAAARGSSKH